MDNVLNFIKSLNIQNKNIVAAISGGPDSMLLLDILIDIKENYKFNIIVAHVHHNLRKESDEEAKTLKQFCKEKNIIFEFKKIKSYVNNKFTEEDARKQRYEFFAEVLKKYNTDILFTAHHGDDLIETILMRLTRGSTVKGYSGFQLISSDKGYKIARPLIYLTKKEIKDILDSKGLWYANDLSNFNLKYTRNRYRNKILPELKKENANVHLKFLEYSKKIYELDSYVKSVAANYYSKIVINNELDLLEYAKLDDVIKRYVLEKFLYNIYNEDILLISNQHVNLIMKELCKKSSKFNLPKNKIGIVEYNKFKIETNIIFDGYDYTFIDEISFNNSKIFVDNDTKLTSNYVIHLCSKEIKLPFHVRNFHKGDFMYVKNLNGKKNISNIFTDFKLPKQLRSVYPIVTDDDGVVLWIPGIKKSNLDRKKEEKYDIILKYITGGIE